jgi:hypothetical protein
MGGAERWDLGARRRRNRVIRRNAALLTVVVLFTAGAFLPALLVTHGPLRWVVLGAISVGTAWMFTRLLRGESRHGPGRARRFTSRHLKRLHRHGWSHLDGIPVGGTDVDHALFGRGGVFAIQTTWTGGDVRIERGSIKGAVGDLVARAAEGGRRVANLLRSRGVNVPVISALVMWGPGTGGLETTFLNSGVLLLAGHHGQRWHAELPTAETPIGNTTLQDIERMLRTQMASGADPGQAIAPLIPLRPGTAAQAAEIS